MSTTCQNCKQEIPAEVVTCPSCGRFAQDDLFGAEELKAPVQAPPTPKPIPRPIPVMPHEQAPKLTLDLPQVCGQCNQPIRGVNNRMDGVCPVCKAKKRADQIKVDQDPKQKRIKVKPAQKNRSQRRAGSGKGLWIILLLVVPLGLLAWYFMPKEPIAKDGKKLDLKNILQKKGQGHLSPAEAVAKVAELLENLPLPPMESKKSEFLDLEARLREGNIQHGDFQKYVENWAEQSGGDDNDPLMQALVYGDIEDYPAARAKAMAAIYQANKKMAKAIKRLEQHAKEHADKQAVKMAYADALANSRPDKALKLIDGQHGAEAGKVRGKALLAQGQTIAAIKELETVTDTDPEAARVLADLYLAAGRCSPAHKMIGRQVGSGGVAGVMRWLQVDTLCGINTKALDELATRILDDESFAVQQRAALAASMATRKLWQNQPKLAQEFCDQAARLAPGQSQVVWAQARCQLAQEIWPKAEELPVPEKPSEHALLAMAKLHQGQLTPGDLEPIPSWRRSRSLLALVFALNQKKPLLPAMLGGMDGWLSPKVDGLTDVPLSDLELSALASLVKKKHSPLIVWLAGMGLDDKNFKPPRKTPKMIRQILLASWAYQHTGHKMAKKAFKQIRGNKLAALKKLLRIRVTQKKAKLLVPLTKRQELEPHAVGLCLRDKVCKNKIEGELLRHWSRHPMVLAGLFF
jgi:tetratricopeptide (TPR) repeat protein